jgi:23S rRNA pseudouridine2605 synthase
MPSEHARPSHRRPSTQSHVSSRSRSAKPAQWVEKPRKDTKDRFSRPPRKAKPAARAAGASRLRSPKPPQAAEDGLQRLQKVLAAAGIGSRRQCEELITAGRIDVDHQVVTELGVRVDPAKQLVRVDGVALPNARLEYFAINKPSGVLCTNRDPAGRTRVVDLVPTKGTRLFTVGRLDQFSDGLILVTNDGELANRLTHPRYGVSKTYRVVVAGDPTRETLDKLEQGVHLSNGLARVEHITVRSHHSKSTLLEMVLNEGKNREIRRVLARVGHKVLRLTRVAVGPIRLGTLAVGEVRRLTSAEVKALKQGGMGGVE